MIRSFLDNKSCFMEVICTRSNKSKDTVIVVFSRNEEIGWIGDSSTRRACVSRLNLRLDTMKPNPHYSSGVHGKGNLRGGERKSILSLPGFMSSVRREMSWDSPSFMSW